MSYVPVGNKFCTSRGCDNVSKSAHSNRRTKAPVWFHRKGNQPFGLAGAWDVWKGPKEMVFAVAILTTTAYDLCKQVHERSFEGPDCLVAPAA